MKWVFVLLLLSNLCYAVPASYIPKKAQSVATALKPIQQQYFPDNPYPWFMMNQAQVESCVRLDSPRCMDPHAQLKTSREWGIGVFEETIAYNNDGSERFNSFKQDQARFPQLKDWNWRGDGKFDIHYQMLTYTLVMKKNWNNVRFAPNPWDRYAFTTVAYNSGFGGILKDRTKCAHAHDGCDPNKWWGNVETHTYKSHKSLGKQYGSNSAYSVSRAYPKIIMVNIGSKYKKLWEAIK